MTTKKPLAMLSKEELNAYKSESYKKNRWNVQRSKLLRGILAGERRPKPETLKKYDIEVNDKGEIIAPVKEKVIINVRDEIDDSSPTVINVVKRRTQPKVTMYNTDNTALTGEQLRNYVLTVLVDEPQKGEGSKPLSETEIEAYSKIGQVLYKLYGIKPYDATADLTPLLNNADALIQVVDSHPTWKAFGTKARFLSRILALSKKWRPIGNLIVPFMAIYNKLDAQYNEWAALAKSKQLDVSSKTEYFIWDDIRDAVILKYGEESFPSLLVQLYEEVVARDDLALQMAYDESDIGDGNYLLLNRKKRTAIVHLSKYKTSKASQPIRFDLSKKLVNLIMRLKPPSDKSPMLFPIEKSKLKDYLISLFSEIPFLRDEKLGIRYIRHSLISTKFMQLDKNSPTFQSDVAELARKSMHSVSMQQSYKSLLKDKNGNRIDTQEQARALEAIHTTRSKTKGVVFDDKSASFEKSSKKTPKSRKLEPEPELKRKAKPKPKAEPEQEPKPKRKPKPVAAAKGKGKLMPKKKAKMTPKKKKKK
jgi:hypothetical protein